MNSADLRTYVLNYKVADESQIKILDRWLRENADIRSIVSPIPLVYFFKSHLSATELSQKMSFLFPGGGFAIAEINILNIDGNMPKFTWDWFYQTKQNDAHGPTNLGIAYR